MNDSSRIPDPGFGWALLGPEEEKLVLQALRSKALFRYYGPDRQHPPAMVATFEREFAEFIGTRYTLAVTSGTAALEVALGALGIGPGDEVIVPAWSWVSCVTAIVRVGALPVLAEIDDTLCLRPEEIDRLATPRTKAVIVVHFQGVSADLDAIVSRAKAKGIAVLEDCAESVGALYRGRRVGTWGEIAIFSFQQQKTITSGEGGLVATNDPKLYERAVRMHDIGQVRPFHAAIVPPQGPAFSGGQFRMTELSAAVLIAQLRKLEGLRQHCRALTARIMARISGLPGLTFRRIPDAAGDSCIEIYFWPAVEFRDRFRSGLEKAGVPCQPMTGTYAQYRRANVVSGLSHAPKATPFPIGAGWPGPGYRPEDFPRTEDLVNRLVAIPVGVNYTEAHADAIAAAICAIHASLGLGR